MSFSVKRVVAGPVPARSGTSKGSVAPADFIQAFYANVLPADLELFSVPERALIAGSIWAMAARRRAGEALVRVFNPALEKDGWTVDHTVIEIVHDDMPFLVDSISGVLQNRGIAVHIAIHPVLSVRRDGAGQALGQALGAAMQENADAQAEAFLHIQIDHCFDGDQLSEIEREMRATLADVTAAVGDYRAMCARMQETSDGLTAASACRKSGEDIDEVKAFLNWLIDDNFTFLGAREIDLAHQNGSMTAISVMPDSGLGILRDDTLRMFGGLRDLDKRDEPAMRKYLRQNHVLFITKTHAITRVHRVLPMDAVFVRRFDDKGAVVSEKLFVGLFTSKTYAQTPRDIPFMRRKIEAVLSRMNFAAKSHNGRNLMHILDTYPHDELFQISEDELYTNALGILQLQERARVALFMRRDPFDRYVTFLVYVPRDRYDSVLRVKIQKFLETTYAGRALSWHVRLDDSLLARAFVTIRLTPESPTPTLAKLESDVRELCRTWSGRLRDSLVTAYGEATALSLLRRYSEAFPETYREAITPVGAVKDVRHLERVRVEPRFVVDLHEKSDGRMSLKLFQPERPLLLSESLPLIENMGLKIDYMGGPYEIRFKDAPSIYIHEFVGKPAAPILESFDKVRPMFEEALAKVWAGEVENDAFNALTLRIGLRWNAVVLMRAFARYLRQLRIPYSHEMMAAALVAHAPVALQIYDLFCARHDPSLKQDREAKQKAMEADLQETLGKIAVLEEDRIIRRYINLVQASLRTNYFQTDAEGKSKPYLSIKFDSRAVDFMPLPKPLYEIFVYSPVTEAVHLRGGKVARGGIRWSDRRDDFRAEILGLMKAQMVKNSVIVPVGSKGGFIVKRPPAEADKMTAEGIACYRIMMAGLLDITDNSKNGRIVPPAQVVRHDGDDPYLVVAADKGTAKFSDIANGISRDYGFWLDDAFASGGSAGYDHKNMGITARGAWEAVKRHFRELGKDIQSQDFTCIGVGDMSGDVFGNGLLLSAHTRLLGAFDHRHIFCDPNPDAAKSHVERKRLFALPRSSWADYDRKLISKGGGVFARTDKAIKLSPEMKKAYGVSADSLSPAALIRAMLMAEVELIYFGGIGTYVKASAESHDEVGDRSCESLRVNGAELRAKVVGEGANLGMTQRGRIEYAQKGGRLNTDAIDNSAGVDTSDHEVNIKILLRKAVDQQKLSLPARDKLLASMTDEVGLLVLRDNYLQTQILSAMEAQAVEHFATHVRCLHFLEKTGLLNRAIEYLPSDAQIAERQKHGRGMTRPELAVLLAYAKIWLYQQILDSALPDDAALKADVEAYFPAALRKSYALDIARHQLRREIAATVLINDIINHTGIDILLLAADSDNVEAVARAYLLAREAFAFPQIWAGLETLDNKVAAAVQTQMMQATTAALSSAMQKVAGEAEMLARLGTGIASARKGVVQLQSWLVQAGGAALLSAQEKEWGAAGVPAELARAVAALPLLAAAFDLIGLAAQNKMRVSDLAALFFGLEKRLEIGGLLRLSAQSAQTPLQRSAMDSARSEMAAHHRRLTAQLAEKKVAGQKDPLLLWVQAHAAALERYDALLAEARAAGSVDLATLVLANATLCALSA